jgi:eukaryotic-like serine/threonine-protein kinase
MSDLLARLQSALGGAYRLERELGGGGMSRVFLAQEAALGRKVVIKVLPPELGAGLNIDRFRREIQLAASLQHPHIVPLLAAGQADDLLYYTMPLVEGESLRARLLRQHELPVGEVVRFLRDVADALACAHEHGVVHRDIKPDNVLVSRNHGMVTDFGVAKALSDSTGGSSLTSVGVALGTPAYMAPEQASADPFADHRVDIYAVGALAYEMLTGRPPFTGSSPQAVLVAQVTQAPPPIGEHRATVPPALASLVMRCLEKKPADRWQSADELIHQLEAMATPSGGTQPVPAIRAEPSQASAVPAAAPAAGLPAGSAGRRVALAGLAAGLLALGAWLATRGHRASGTDAARTDAKMLAVLPFKNLGADEDQYFADGLTEEITSRLAAVNGLGVISRTSADQYRNTPKSLRQVGAELGAGYLLEGSVRWEKTGGASRVRVTPQLIRVRDDRHLWADRYDAELADVFEVQGDIAERVTSALNVTLGQPQRDALAGRPTASSEAYDYYLRGQEYYGRSRGSVGAKEESALRTAEELYRQAIALDSSFALAWAALAKVHDDLHWNFYDRTDSRLAMEKEAAERAVRLDPDLPEAHLALGYYHYHGQLNYPAALSELERARSLKPQDSEVIAAIGFVQRRQGKWAETMESLRRAAALDPRSKEIALDLALAALVTRDYREVDTAAARLRKLNPDLETGYQIQAWSAFSRAGDMAEAARWLREGMAHSDSGRTLGSSAGLSFVLENDPRLRSVMDRVAPGDFTDTSSYYQWKGFLERHRGAREIERAYWDSLRVFLEAKLKAAPDEPVFHTGLATAYAGLGRRSEAIREAHRGVELRPITRDALDHTMRVWELARVYVMVGEQEAAMDQIEYLATIPSWYSVNSYRYWPDWAPLRNNPRFQRLLDGGKP